MASTVRVLWSKTETEWPAATLARVRDQLPNHIVERLPDHHDWRDRQMTLLVKLLLREYLVRSGLDPTLLAELTWSASGRPSLPIEGDFSLAHSAGIAVCAATPTGRIGVDVDDRTRQPTEDLGRALSPAERMAVDSAEQPGAELARVWSYKEAVAKADGRGIAVDLERINTFANSNRLVDATWHVQPLDLDPAVAGHVALSEPGCTLDVAPLAESALLGG
ncbi:MAG: 4'-phosphopantetheinyl transferase superfamily protein [Planctomycetota bacterium]